MNDLPLSIVIITRNEDENIIDCIDSVMNLCDPLGINYEMILVDSNSKDKTIERASKKPCTILQITENRYSCPAAGRYVGMHWASGDLIMFVDGDMVLTDGWLSDAINYLNRSERVAGVSGYYSYETIRSDRPVETSSLRGLCLFKTGALLEVRGFDPSISSDEEWELGFRLSENDYNLIRLPQYVACHPASMEEQGYFEIVRRWQGGFYDGRGEILRKHIWDMNLFPNYYLRYKSQILATAWLAVVPITFPISPYILYIWTFLSILLFVFSIRHFGFSQSTYLALSFPFKTLGVVRGFLKYDPERKKKLDTKDGVEVIKIQS